MTIEMCGSAGKAAGRGRCAAAIWVAPTSTKEKSFPAGHEGSCLHDVVLDGAIRPAAVAADRPDAPGAQGGGQPFVLAQGPLRDVDVGRVEDDRVLGHQPLRG